LLQSADQPPSQDVEVEVRPARAPQYAAIVSLRGEHDRISPLPGPGVFATGNSVAVPAILPDGSVAPESISAIIDATPVEESAAPEADAHALTGPHREDEA
jgi:NADH-quinone oxidoreductase subunit J